MAKSSQDIKQGKAYSFALSNLENLIYDKIPCLNTISFVWLQAVFVGSDLQNLIEIKPLVCVMSGQKWTKSLDFVILCANFSTFFQQILNVVKNQVDSTRL